MLLANYFPGSPDLQLNKHTNSFFQQYIYFRQLEIQGQVIDAITKQESLLQTYIKMKNDTTNSYFRNYKILADMNRDDTVSGGLEELLKTVGELLKPSTGNPNINNKKQTATINLLELAESELQEENYN